MKKIILLAFLSITTYSINAQGCDPFYINDNCVSQPPKIVGGYTVYYKICNNVIFIDSFTFSDTTTGAAPGLNFTNVVIPSILDIQDGADVFFPASCVAWKITGWNVKTRPNGIPGSGTTEGIIQTYALVNCSGQGCCKWTRMGDGILEDDFGFANDAPGCPFIIDTLPLTMPPIEIKVQCFPICSEMRKAVWSPIKGEVPMTLSPNPASNYIKLSHITNITSIVIYDNLGRIVYSKEASSNLIDVSTFQKGTYFMQLNRTDGKHEAKNFQIH